MKDKEKRRRCPNGSRFKNETGQCEDKKEAAITKFCKLASELKKALETNQINKKNIQKTRKIFRF